MNKELQEEEREVILSIYDGDTSFHQFSPLTYQYKYGKEGADKSFLLEISWGDNYPEELPAVNMDTFYNKHLSEAAKKHVRDFVLSEAEQLLGTAMTYSLFESVKEKLDELLTEGMINEEEINGDPNEDDAAKEERSAGDDDVETSDEEDVAKEAGCSKSRPKKEHLTKAQKRRQWDRVDCRGERPRGWNWVDVIHHLGQTGPKASPLVHNS